MLGCEGAHEIGDDMWGPCESPGDLKKLIRWGNPKFREWKENQKKSLNSKPKFGRLEFPTKQEALRAARMMGSRGAHMVRQGVWSPCESPADLRDHINKRGTGGLVGGYRRGAFSGIQQFQNGGKLSSK